MSGQGTPLNQASAEPRWLENHAMGNPVACCETKSRVLACMMHVINMACIMAPSGGMEGRRTGWSVAMPLATHGNHSIIHPWDARKWPDKWEGRERGTYMMQYGNMTAHTQRERGRGTIEVTEATPHGPGRPPEDLQSIPACPAAQLRGSTPRGKMGPE